MEMRDERETNKSSDVDVMCWMSAMNGVVYYGGSPSVSASKQARGNNGMLRDGIQNSNTPFALTTL